MIRYAIVIGLIAAVLIAIYLVISKGSPTANSVSDKAGSQTQSKDMRFPNDDDGNVLRLLYERGTDFTKPHLIDFCIAVPSKENGEKVKEAMTSRGFNCNVEQDGQSKTWTCYCSKEMMLEYDEIIRIQKMINEVAKPFNGFSDGWGTLTN